VGRQAGQGCYMLLRLSSLCFYQITLYKKTCIERICVSSLFVFGCCNGHSAFAFIQRFPRGRAEEKKKKKKKEEEKRQKPTSPPTADALCINGSGANQMGGSDKKR
jgi:hypothetical protein